MDLSRCFAIMCNGNKESQFSAVVLNGLIIFYIMKSSRFFNKIREKLCAYYASYFYDNKYDLQLVFFRDKKVPEKLLWKLTRLTEFSFTTLKPSCVAPIKTIQKKQ